MHVLLFQPSSSRIAKPWVDKQHIWMPKTQHVSTQLMPASPRGNWELLPQHNLGIHAFYSDMLALMWGNKEIAAPHWIGKPYCRQAGRQADGWNRAMCPCWFPLCLVAELSKVVFSKALDIPDIPVFLSYFNLLWQIAHLIFEPFHA